MTVAMPPREIVRRALAGQAALRPATGPLAVHYCARNAGVSMRDYTTQARILAECVVRYYERFQPDAVWLSADTWVTAQAMGARLAFPAEGQPLAGTGSPLVQEATDIARIPPPDPTSQGRGPLMIEAMQRIHDALGRDVFLVACFDQYPFSVACALMGIEKVMLKLHDDRSMVEALMEHATDYVLAYARALADAGADLLSGGDSPAGLLGPELYRTVALPFEQRVIAELKSRLTLPISLHICGNAHPILPDMARSGADVLELDHWVELRRACQQVSEELTIWGNLDPVGVLAQGTPELVRERTRDLLHTFRECGHRRFVISSGCTLAWETPPENLQAMLETARQFEL